MTTGPAGKCLQPPSALYRLSLVLPVSSLYLWFLLFSHSCVQLFCDPVGCSPPGSSVRGKFLAKIAGMCCCFLLWGIFPTQGLNLRICVSCTAGRFFTAGPGETLYKENSNHAYSCMWFFSSCSFGGPWCCRYNTLFLFPAQCCSLVHTGPACLSTLSKYLILNTNLVHKELPKGQTVVRIWDCRMTIVPESGLRIVSWKRGRLSWTR